MAVPVWSVGEVLAASDVNNWFVPLASFKQGTTTRSTLALSADPALQVTLPSGNSFYEIRCGISYSCTSGGLSWTFQVPSGAIGTQQATGNLGGSGSALNANWTDTSSANSSANGALQITGVIATGTGTGTFAFSWASNSGPSACSLLQGSYLIARRIG